MSWHTYVVELHDVHPTSLPAIDRMLDTLCEPARHAAALLIVPNWAGQEPIRFDSPFAARVRSLPNDIVLHGLTHVRGASAWSWFCYGTPDENEFLGLSGSTARQGIADGLTALDHALGRRPRWFCAPRWRQNRELPAALAACGMDWYMRTDAYASTTGRRHAIAAAWFDGGPRLWQRLVTAAIAERRIATCLTSGAAFRLVLHPRDLQHPATWRVVTRVLDRLNREGWTPVSLEQAVSS